MIEYTQNLSMFRKSNINSTVNKYDCFIMNDYIFKKKNIFVMPKTNSQIATFDLLNHFLHEDYFESILNERFIDIMREQLKSILYSLILLSSSIIGIIMTFNLLENPSLNVVPVILIFTSSSSLIWVSLSIIRYLKVKMYHSEAELFIKTGKLNENYTLDKEFLKLLIFKHFYENDKDYEFMMKIKEKNN